MSLLNRLRQSDALHVPVTALTIAFLVLPPSLVPAGSPAWWTEQHVLKVGSSPDDFAVLNQGQLKNLVRGAVAALDASLLPDPSRDTLHQMVASWSSSTNVTDDYAAVNLGQLKSVARLVYDQLPVKPEGTGYPWSSATGADDFALANIGQAKRLFSFVVMASPAQLAAQFEQLTTSPEWHLLQTALNGTWIGLMTLEQSQKLSETLQKLNSAAMAGALDYATQSGNQPIGTQQVAAAHQASQSPEGQRNLQKALDNLDSDNDGVRDKDDAVPYDPALNFPRAAVPHYAVIDLEEGVARGLGEKGHMLWTNLNDSSAYRYWSPDSGEAVDVPNKGPDDYDPDRNYGYVFEPGGITADGSVVGTAINWHRNGGDAHRRPAKWNPSGDPNAHATWLSDPPDYLANSWTGYDQDAYPGPDNSVYSTPRYTSLTLWSEAPDPIYCEYKTVTKTPLSGDPATNIEQHRYISQPALPEDPPDYFDLDYTMPLLDQAHDYWTSLSLPRSGGVLYQTDHNIYDCQAKVVTNLDGWSFGKNWELVTISKEHRITNTLYTVDANGPHTIVLQTVLNGVLLNTHEFTGAYVNESAPDTTGATWLVSNKVVAVDDYGWGLTPSIKEAQLWTGLEPARAPHALYASKEDYEAQHPLSYAWLMDRFHRIWVWSDKTDPDTGYAISGLWVNGELHEWKELIGEDTYNRYADWYNVSMNADGMIAASAKLAKNPDGSDIPVAERKTHVLALMPVEFFTKGENGRMASVDFAVNGTAAPGIDAQMTATISAGGVVAVGISGTIADATSDLIDAPAKQLQSLKVESPGASQRVNLTNTAGGEELPWKPYKWGASFAASASFAVAGPGEYPVTITTDLNAAGMAASTTAYVTVTQDTTHIDLSNLAADGIDSLRFYENISTGGAEEIMTENSEASRMFAFATASTNAGFKVEILSPTVLTNDVDTLHVRFHHFAANGSDVFEDRDFVETGPSTKQFTCTQLNAAGSSFAKTNPGFFFPIMMRLPLLDMFGAADFRMNTMDHDWQVMKKDCGDGEYYYVVDDQGKAVVFNPSAYAHTHIQTKALNSDWVFRLKKAGANIAEVELKKFEGLLIRGGVNSTFFNDSLVAGTFVQDARVIENTIWTNVRPLKGGPVGHKNLADSVKPEILWRYVNAKNTIVYFNGFSDLKRDIDYRENVVKAANAVTFAYIGDGSQVPDADLSNPDVEGHRKEKWNTLLWDMNNEGDAIKILDGIAVNKELTGLGQSKGAFKAIEDMFNQPQENKGVYNSSTYATACLGGALWVSLRGLSQAVTEGVFNAKVGPAPLQSGQSRLLQEREIPKEMKAFWVPGDWGFIENTKYDSASTGMLGCEGENVIYLGGSFEDADFDKFSSEASFWGHGFGTAKLDQMLIVLKKWVISRSGPGADVRITSLRRDINHDAFR